MKRLVEFLESFVVVGLVLAGVGGIAYHLFREQGWIEGWLGSVWKLELRLLVLVLILVVIGVVVFKVWRGGKAIHGRTSIIPNLFLYALMGAGVYFVGRYAITGAL